MIGPQHDEKLVSVVVPAYNAGTTIDETLRSVRSQTYRNLEIIVVDDGSSDGTRTIVARHAAADVRIRLIQQSNGGVAAARNAGISQARGEMLAFVDADDLWAPEKIAKQIAALQAAGPHCALVYTWYALINEDSCIIDESDRPSASGDVLEKLCHGNVVGNGSSALITRAALLEVGGFNPALRAQSAQGCEDFHLYFRIAERHQFALVPEHLTGYRMRPTNMSSDLFQMYRSWMLVIGEMHDRQPKLASMIRAGTNLYIASLLKRAIEFRQPRQSVYFAARLLLRDPWLLTHTLRQLMRGTLSPPSKRSRHGYGPQAPKPKRFSIGEPGAGSS